MKQTQEGIVKTVGVWVTYDDKVALKDISWSVAPASLAAIIGPNGGGKSTLLKSLVGLVRPTRGVLTVFDVAPRAARRRVAYLPQAEEVDWLFPITSLEVVLQGRLVHRPWWQRATRADREQAGELLHRVGMEKVAYQPIGSLSGGQRQRVFIARALAQQASLILLDEPASGLDAAAQHDLLALFEELRCDGYTVIITTHDLNCLAGHFDTVLGIDCETVVQGVPSQVLNADVLTHLFGRHFPVVRSTGEVAMHER